MSYEKPQVKKIEADVSVRNMADDKGECHGGHCVRCIHAFGSRILSPRCARVSQSVCRPYADAEDHPPSKKPPNM